jgi:hypothetical protein
LQSTLALFALGLSLVGHKLIGNAAEVAKEAHWFALRLFLTKSLPFQKAEGSGQSSLTCCRPTSSVAAAPQNGSRVK